MVVLFLGTFMVVASSWCFCSIVEIIIVWGWL